MRETEEKIHALEAEILDLEEEKYKVESNFYKNLRSGTDARINLVLKGICLVLMLIVAIWLKTKQKNRHEKMDMKIPKTPKLKMEIPERKNKSDKK